MRFIEYIMITYSSIYKKFFASAHMFTHNMQSAFGRIEYCELLSKLVNKCFLVLNFRLVVYITYIRITCSTLSRAAFEI